jgi:hypothetical protein
MEAVELTLTGRMWMPTGITSVKPLHSGNGSPHRPMNPVGFWNNLPAEEERIPLPPMEPHYGHKERVFETVGWVDIREMTVFLGILYTSIGCTHLAIIFLNWVG